MTGFSHLPTRWADAYESDPRVWHPGQKRPDYAAEFNRRVQLIQRMRADPKRAAYLPAHYRWNPVDFILDWCVTIDPRNQEIDGLPQLMPFCLFARQIDMIQFVVECWRDGESGLVEKVRGYGATWTFAALSLWWWLYHPGVDIGWGANKAELVDKLGVMSTILEKIRALIRHMPRDLWPLGFDDKAHLMHMRLINPANGSAIFGEGGLSMGRGGRAGVYFVDEAAHIENPDAIDASLSGTTNTRIELSTVNGTGNLFHRRRVGGTVWEPGRKVPPGHTRVLVVDWREHPEKTQAWYDRGRAKAEREGTLATFAQEVERDYNASRDNVLIPGAWISAAIGAAERLGLRSSGAVVAGMDVADEGGDKNAMAITHGCRLIHVEQSGRGADDCARDYLPTAQLYGAREFWYDAGGGYGATVKSVARSTGCPLRVAPFDPAGGVVHPAADDIGGTVVGDKDRRTNKDHFANYKAQAWYNLRLRFWRVWRWVEYGERCDPDEIITLPADAPWVYELTHELGQPTFSRNGAGKIVVDKKPNGSRSPNMADAVVIAFAPKALQADMDDFGGIGGVQTTAGIERGQTVW